MVVVAACHVDGHAPAYWTCTASRVRLLAPRLAQHALGPASVRIASRPRARAGHDDSRTYSCSRHGSRSQLPLKIALGLTFDIGLTLVSVRFRPFSLFAPTRMARRKKPSADGRGLLAGSGGGRRGYYLQSNS